MDHSKLHLLFVTKLWFIIDTVSITTLILNAYFVESLITPSTLYAFLSGTITVIICTLINISNNDDTITSKISIGLLIAIEALNIITTVFLRNDNIKLIFIVGLSLKLLSNCIRLLMIKHKCDSNENIEISNVNIDIYVILDIITILILGIISYYNNKLLTIFAIYTTIGSFMMILIWIYRIHKLESPHALYVIPFIIDLVCVLLWLPYTELNYTLIWIVIICKITVTGIKLLI